jgi:shikimate kinase
MKPNKNIILIGMPAVGKSTIGVLLAKRLKYADVTVVTDGLTPDQVVREIISFDPGISIFSRK